MTIKNKEEAWTAIERDGMNLAVIYVLVLWFERQTSITRISTFDVFKMKNRNTYLQILHDIMDHPVCIQTILDTFDQTTTRFLITHPTTKEQPISTLS